MFMPIAEKYALLSKCTRGKKTNFNKKLISDDLNNEQKRIILIT